MCASEVAVRGHPVSLDHIIGRDDGGRFQALKEPDPHVSDCFQQSSGCDPSAIQQLPVELLSYIFALVDATNNSRPLSTAVLLISHVNRDWRWIALNNPILWSRLSIIWSPGSLCADIPSGSIHLVKCFLKRAQNAPLHVTVSCPKIGSSTSTLLDILFAQVVRWKSVDLTLPLKFYFSSQFSVRAEAPLLESARFVGVGLPDLGLSHRQICCNWILPALRTFTLCGKLGACVGVQSFPWTNLSTLSLTGSSSDTLLNVLQLASPTLRELHLEGLTDLAISPALITFPRLHSLRVSEHLETGILACIEAPLLTEAGLVFWIPRATVDPKIYAKFLSRSPLLHRLLVFANTPTFLKHIDHQTALQRMAISVAPFIESCVDIRLWIESLLSSDSTESTSQPPSLFRHLNLIHIYVSLRSFVGRETVEALSRLLYSFEALSHQRKQLTSCPNLELLVLRASSSPEDKHPLFGQLEQMSQAFAGEDDVQILFPSSLTHSDHDV